MAVPQSVPIESETDVARARRAARALSQRIGLDRIAVEEVALAVTELATNLLRHAQSGELVLVEVEGPRGSGLQVESRDSGPGIRDLRPALEDGFSTRGGLGGGLPGVRRLMDDFSIESGRGGTTVVARKWAARH
jgi:serine/threonine-protein kinase RsbT